MYALNDLVVSGKVIYLGVSDTPAWYESFVPVIRLPPSPAAT